MIEGPNPSLRLVGQLDEAFQRPQNDDSAALSLVQEAVSLAQQVAAHALGGAKAMIAGCVLVAKALDRFPQGSAARKAFIDALVHQNVIPRRSSRIGEFDLSKLSMLRKIGENAALLLSEDLIAHLQPGYSVLYHMVRYYEVLDGDHASRIARLADAFSREGHLTRDFLSARIKEAEKRHATKPPPAFDALEKSGELFDLIHAVPTPTDLKRLREHYQSPPPCLRVYERVAKEATAVILVPLKDLATVEDRLLPGCGFSSVSKVYLVHQPSQADVTDVPVIVVAHRSRQPLVYVDWELGDLDLDVLVERLAPGARCKLYLFANTETSGFACLIKDANWESAP